MIEVSNVHIKRRIILGDSLSSLLFVMAVDPLSRLLNKMQTGYNTRKRNETRHFIINRQLHMDDLKLFNFNKNKMKK